MNERRKSEVLDEALNAKLVLLLGEYRLEELIRGLAAYHQRCLEAEAGWCSETRDRCRHQMNVLFACHRKLTEEGEYNE